MSWVNTLTNTPLAFLKRLDSGEIYRDFAAQIKNLSAEDRAEVTRLLLQREEQRTSFDAKWYTQFVAED
jgi:hypothetical protein